jgi:glyoxylase-like metal-dependent hydrolase (beta-lactamase superfamily II)
VITPAAIDQILALGQPRLLIVSHKDFLGPATLWTEALDIPLWIGTDAPIGRNRAAVTQRVTTVMSPCEGSEVLPVPGHSPGSIALYWSAAPGGPVLCAGDALAVQRHAEGRTQLAYFQAPPIGPEIASLTARPVETLAACGGALRHASKWLGRLAPAAAHCARPYLGERGGLWIESGESGA